MKGWHLRWLWARRQGLWPIMVWVGLLLLAFHLLGDQTDVLRLQWLISWWSWIFVGAWWVEGWLEGGLGLWFFAKRGFSCMVGEALWVQGLVVWMAGLGFQAILLLLQGAEWAEMLFFLAIFTLMSLPVGLIAAWVSILSAGMREHALLLGGVLMPLLLPWLMLGSNLLQAWRMGQPFEQGLWILGGLSALAMAVLPNLLVWALRQRVMLDYG